MTAGNFTLCGTDGCDRRATTRGHCESCYRRWVRGLPSKPPPVAPTNVIVCPDDYLDAVAEAVDADARPFFVTLWRLLGEAAWVGIPFEQYVKTIKDEAC